MKQRLWKYRSLFVLGVIVASFVKFICGSNWKNFNTGAPVENVELIYSDTSEVACPTGIPVFSKTDSLRMGKDGLQVVILVWSQYNTPYAYQEKFKLSKLEDERFIEVDVKDDTTWSEKEYRLKKNVKTEIVFDVGKYYGELEPGHYSVQKELRYTYPKTEQENSISVSAAFRIFE